MHSTSLISPERPRARNLLRTGARFTLAPRTLPAHKRGPSATPERLQQLAWGFAPPMVVEAALRHRLFDFLDNSPLPASEVAKKAGISLRGATALLDALVGLELLRRRGGRYTLTPESSTFLVSTRPGYHGGYFRNLMEQVLPGWLKLPEVARTGRPVVSLNNASQGEEFFSEFVESLFPLNYRAAQTLGEHLGLRRARAPLSVLDLAAGSGVWGIGLAHQSPFVSLLAVDLPRVLEVTRAMAQRHGIGDRLTTAEGDLLEADFGTEHEVAVLGHILHSEGADRSRRLLKKVFPALRHGGTVAISEFVPNDERTGPAAALIFAVNMLVHTDTGSTFTFAEMSGWLKEAGFVQPRLLEVPAPSPLVLATKP
jgi:3-hydroxy-5-methyl-1-naphthoate 3-O-methyltransferase